jgi:hypothetical protein
MLGPRREFSKLPASISIVAHTRAVWETATLARRHRREQARVLEVDREVRFPPFWPAYAVRAAGDGPEDDGWVRTNDSVSAQTHEGSAATHGGR